MAFTDDDKAWVAQLLDSKLDAKLSPIHKSIDTLSGKIDVALLSVSRHVSELDAHAVEGVLRTGEQTPAYRRRARAAMVVHLWPLTQEDAA